MQTDATVVFLQFFIHIFVAIDFNIFFLLETGVEGLCFVSRMEASSVAGRYHVAAEASSWVHALVMSCAQLHA